MKSERRHELQKNTLNAEIGKMAAFFKQHGRGISWVLLIAAVLFLGWTLLRRRSQRQIAEARIRFAQIQRPVFEPADTDEKYLVDFDELSKQTADPRIAAAATYERGRIYAAQAALSEAHSGRDQKIQKARDCFQQALDMSGDYPALASNAVLGLGLLALDCEQLDEAREARERLGELQWNGYPAADMGKMILEDQEQSSEPIRLAREAPPWVKTTEPSSLLKPPAEASVTVVPEIEPAVGEEEKDKKISD